MRHGFSFSSTLSLSLSLFSASSSCHRPRQSCRSRFDSMSANPDNRRHLITLFCPISTPSPIQTTYSLMPLLYSHPLLVVAPNPFLPISIYVSHITFQSSKSSQSSNTIHTVKQLYYTKTAQRSHSIKPNLHLILFHLACLAGSPSAVCSSTSLLCPPKSARACKICGAHGHALGPTTIQHALMHHFDFTPI
jgi:hypothetical protein